MKKTKSKRLLRASKEDKERLNLKRRKLMMKIKSRIFGELNLSSQTLLKHLEIIKKRQVLRLKLLSSPCQDSPIIPLLKIIRKF
jgi:hypothetical protein